MPSREAARQGSIGRFFRPAGWQSMGAFGCLSSLTSPTRSSPFRT